MTIQIPFAAHLLQPDIQANAARNKALIAACFHVSPGPFREKFDEHIRAWRRAKGREAYVLYHRDPAFAAAYEAHRATMRALPMPEWRARA